MSSDSDSYSDSEPPPAAAAAAPAVEVVAAPVKTVAKGKGKGGKKGKGKGKGGGGGGGGGDDADDLDALMAEIEGGGPASKTKSTPKEAETAADAGPAVAPMEDPAAAAAAFLAQMGAGAGAGEESKSKKKKKKKKGGGGGDKKEDDEDKKPKQSAAGKLLAERMARQREEEERIRKIEEEEARLIAEEEAKEEAARKAVEEEKARKRAKAKEKLDRKKKEGTYKTKKQKEQEARAEAAKAAMLAAGLEVPSVPTDGATAGGGKKSKIVYGKRKPANKSKQAAPAPAPTVEDKPPPPPTPPASDTKAEEEEKKSKEKEEEEKVKAAEEEEEAGADAADDWEDAVDDWDSADVTELLGNITVKDGSSSNKFDDEEEDLIEKDKRDEMERLKQQGIRQQKLEAIRKEEEERHRKEEAERQRQILQAEMLKDEARRKRLEREKSAREARNADSLRSPIVCIMGHVDTGKTKLLDKIRQTSVQEGEAGGITQQIGATFFSKETLCEKVEELNQTMKVDVKLPGMLIIDTPGHESFTNLRSRGSSLCDIAILVVDLMHGLEPQTIESLNLLRSKRTPFVIALNKIDRCYAWKSTPDGPARLSLDKQESGTTAEFEDRKGLNTELYWKNDDPTHTVSMVPTSAITGEGIPDLLLWLVRLTQERLTEKIMFMPDLLECTVLEVKAIDGLGMTIDVIIVNGRLKEGDAIVVCTLDGPVVTNIRALLTPPPNRELRIKSEYVHHKAISGAIGVKICATGIEKAVAGTPIMVVGPDDDEEDIKEEVMRDFTDLMKMDLEPKGVMVQASTLGALEALMQFLRKECDPPIPVFAVGIGAVFKKDVMRASIMNEKGTPEYATILAFDVKIDSDARRYADENGVRIFTADIIYHLFDQFTAHMDRLMEQRRQDAKNLAVFPCIVKIMKEHVFNMKDPIIVGMEVIEGNLRVGTPLCIPAMGGMEIGRVTSIEQNHREVDKMGKGSSGAVRVDDAHGGSTLTYGRQFSADSGSLYSSITRETINALKAHFREQLTKDDLRLLVQLKKVFNIP
ncbi:EIF5B, eukaryotic translation initiation factor 5B [Ectocarpus siliculosus]|uniref:Eukaryotic translation initiation factor 5B n=1 Tax=Ectocarpus siliculosus TaxID=2880 RepID=D8LKY1_ECTSI|nr:EIF5B, eukaryotic translation initiation factor 5B [Ectocarpus siliculosus]|eukprot:CBN80114.1 EIF5B, eukaryotic translation initiation factor 5B [Ectocarpus siliculosus]